MKGYTGLMENSVNNLERNKAPREKYKYERLYP